MTSIPARPQTLSGNQTADDCLSDDDTLGGLSDSETLDDNIDYGEPPVPFEDTGFFASRGGRRSQGSLVVSNPQVLQLPQLPDMHLSVAKR